MPRPPFAGDPHLVAYHAAADPSDRARVRKTAREVVAARARFNLASFASHYRACFHSRDAAVQAVDHALAQANHWVADCGDAHRAAHAYRTRLESLRAMITRGA
jgi:hypothetical protein